MVTVPELQTLYLNLLKDALRNIWHQPDPNTPLSAAEMRQAEVSREAVQQRFGHLLRMPYLPQRQQVVELLERDAAYLANWYRGNSPQAHSLADGPALDDTEACVRTVVAEGIPGDLMECGVWRGGQGILMRGVLKALGDTTRVVWMADSFAGLPTPNEVVSPVDAISHELLRVVGSFQVSEDEVRENFRAFGLLDGQVRFLPGWFHRSLPSAPVERLAVLRLDGDYYESTMPALEHLYPKLSPGGFLVIDDYNIEQMGARRAVHEYRARHGIEEPIEPINRWAVRWRKSGSGGASAE